jgi:hypothetical protein
LEGVWESVGDVWRGPDSGKGFPGTPGKGFPELRERVSRNSGEGFPGTPGKGFPELWEMVSRNSRKDVGDVWGRLENSRKPRET